ncbi:hypothetical protein V6255_04270 [Psychromonas arctica]|uniref:Tc1-like transposase DDE domain-containing protein n=1 Tax=Psychromonas arctica TaxID=168275 RepID=A0ABU9H8Y6_9GAMM
MEGKGWHTNGIDSGFDNVSVIKCPPYSSGLNPIDQVWSWIQQHHLAVISIVDEVVTHGIDLLAIIKG